MGLLVYFSTQSENTHRFMQRVDPTARRIPLSPKEDMLEIKEPYVLVSPTYADAQGRGAVPKQVIRFLNIEENRSYIRGVIAGGNRNFGEYFACAGDVISKKCNVPCLYRFELTGTDEDVQNVRQGMEKLWRS